MAQKLISIWSIRLFISLVCSLQFCADQVYGQDPICTAQQLEVCAKNLMRYSRDDVQIPTTEQEVIDNCEIIKNGSKCIRNYFNKCSPSVIKQMTKVAMAGVSRTISKNCSPKGVKELLKHRDCMNDVKGSIKTCYNELVADVYRIKASPRKDWHLLTCCFISKFHECNADAIKKTCREESHEYYMKESNKLMDELMELFCPDNFRWGLSDCVAVTANLPDPNLPKDATPTMLSLVVDMMKQFAETE